MIESDIRDQRPISRALIGPFGLFGAFSLFGPFAFLAFLALFGPFGLL
jgi:hypothetical protein